VQAHRALIKDPFDPEVIAAARANGVPEAMLESARNSPVYKFVKKWGLALPLHAEFRTLPMLFYVPPMLPVLASQKDGRYDVSGAGQNGGPPAISTLDQARVPIRYMASLFSAGNEDVVAAVYAKLLAVRTFMRAKTVGDVDPAELESTLAAGKTNPEEAEAIFRLTSMPTFDERFVVPPLGRDQAVEATVDPYTERSHSGFGSRKPPERRW